MKLRNDRTDNASQKATTARRALLLSPLLAGGLALGACGDTINNYYYNGGDGGAPADALKADGGARPDSLQSDSRKTDACVSSKICSVREEKADVTVSFPDGKAGSFTLKEGESVTTNGITMKVKDIGEDVSATPMCTISNKKATLETTYSASNIVVFTLKEGESATSGGITTKLTGISVSTGALECSNDKVLAAGVLNQGESLNLPGVESPVGYKLVLDDGQVLDGKNYAIVSLTDSCGVILMKAKIQEGSMKEFHLNGEKLEVSVVEAAFGLTFGAKWANFSVKSPCDDGEKYWCPAVAGVLNQGESMSVDSLKFQLDDLSTTGTTNYALISILDANGNVIAKEKIAEGSTLEKTLNGKAYQIRVKTVAPGYTYGAKWADIEIGLQGSKPCGS